MSKRNWIPDPMSPTSNYWWMIACAWFTGILAQAHDDPTLGMVIAIGMVIHANGARITAAIKEKKEVGA